MLKKSKLIITDSYFNVFPLLTEQLKNLPVSLTQKNIVFCEEKNSLMAERYICNSFGGTFNTEVYSFGKFLRKENDNVNVLSKEGASMVIRRVLSDVQLKRFRINKSNLSSTLYELIAQLKSAKVSVSDLYKAIDNTSGILRDKLEDISAVYYGYQKVLEERSFTDQHSNLEKLPKIIEQSDKIKNANVFIVGYSSWTRQIREVLRSVLKTAKSVTAILTGGENSNLFVNETPTAFKDICKCLGIEVETNKKESPYILEAKIITEGIFNPLKKAKREDTDKVTVTCANSLREEVEIVAESIKGKVVSKGCRYQDVTVCIPDVNLYASDIEEVFTLLDIPYFIDRKKKVTAHPLIGLIYSYIDCFRKNLEKDTLFSFYKNPLFCSDKALTDAFYLYVEKYNIDHYKINQKFTFEKGSENFNELEDFRKKIAGIFTEFSIRNMLETLNVKEKLKDLTGILKLHGEIEEAAVNEQVYEKVCSVLDQMDLILGGTPLNYSEIKEVLKSGFSALELSIIPQYKDAVFIGSYKETALATNRYVFSLGLNEDVPCGQLDTSLLKDSEIDALCDIKVIIEPKIQLVNARTRENVGLSLSAFTERLFMSYCSMGKDGNAHMESECIQTIDRLLCCKGYRYVNGYITKKQGLNSFAKEIGRFAYNESTDIKNATAFYYATEKEPKYLLERANKEIKVRLNLSDRKVIDSKTSPTTIEEYYSCPYKAFASKCLMLNNKEEGEIDALSIGNIVHEVFKGFVEKIKAEDIDVEKTYQEIVSSTLSDERFSRLLQDSLNKVVVERIIGEGEKYCKSFYEHFKNSDFKPYIIEGTFGEEKNSLPAISLAGGKVKLKGKIDRVDKFNDYYRIIDYKTGKCEDKIKPNELYFGLCLQLYLYALAVNGKVAGLYYMPIKDKFSSEDKKEGISMMGRTLNDVKIISAQDKSLEKTGVSELLKVEINEKGIKGVTDEKVIKALIDYAKQISDKAGEQMLDGVIVASPCKKACMNCQYKGLCDNEDLKERELKPVKEQTILQAVDGETNGY